MLSSAQNSFLTSFTCEIKFLWSKLFHLPRDLMTIYGHVTISRYCFDLQLRTPRALSTTPLHRLKSTPKVTSYCNSCFYKRVFNYSDFSSGFLPLNFCTATFHTLVCTPIPRLLYNTKIKCRELLNFQSTNIYRPYY